jgi:hypothetical protein
VQLGVIQPNGQPANQPVITKNTMAAQNAVGVTRTPFTITVTAPTTEKAPAA